LESLRTITTKIGNLDVLIAIFIDIWQRIAGNQRNKRKLGSVTSTTK